MPDELDTVLRWVADGRLTPDEAAPIIEALTRANRPAEPDPDDGEEDPFAAGFDRLGRRIERQASRAGARVERAFARAERARDRAEAEAERFGGRHLRIRVTERGRQVVNLRIPIGFVETALRFVPGLGGDQETRIREAVRAGATGPILDVEDADGEGGVLISLE